MEIAGYALSVLMGLSLGMIGGGGSIMTVPILIYFFRQDPLLATTGSLFVVGVAALLGAVMNARRGNVDLKMGLTFAAPSFLGVFVIRRIVLPTIPNVVHILGNFEISKGAVVLFCFAILMVFASRAMIASGRSKAPATEDGKKHGLFSTGVKGFFVGCATAFVGAGGGFLIIPALVVLLGMPMRIAVGTSLAIIAANSLFGFAISSDLGLMNWPLLLTITALGAIGLTAGNLVASKVNERKLKQGFGYFVLIIGFAILADQLVKLH